MLPMQPLSRDKADTLLLLIACCLVLAPHALHLPHWVTAASVVLLAWRIWITFRGNRMPPRWVLAPIAVLTLPGVYWNFQTFFGRDAGVAMLVLLLACKLLEMRAKRDLFVVVCLCFFLMLTNLFYSQSVGTAALMLVATLAIVTTQLSFQYTGAVPSLAQRLRLGATILGLAAPLTMVLFFLFPRIQGPLWGMPSDAQGSHSGLSETMAPGNIAKLALSEEIVFRVKFIDAVPVHPALYWRGVVLGNYDGRTWGKLRPAKNGRSDDPGSAARPRPGTIIPRGSPVRYQVTLEPSGQRWLYALELPLAAPTLNHNIGRFTNDLQLVADHAVTTRIRYELSSIVNFAMQPDEDQIALQDWLDLPPGLNPQTHLLAARLRRQSDDPGALIRAVLSMFRSQPFRYTLEPPPLGHNAVDDFLFTTQAGFCEHYASAFVVLMRALDIPARVVTGYQGGQLNPNDGYLTIRQADAHAWAEVWLQNRGWTRIDPTAAVAPERIEHSIARMFPTPAFGTWIPFDLRKQSWLAVTRLRLDALNNGWNQWVLDYSPERQRSLLEILGLRRVDWSTLTLLLILSGSAAVALFALPLVWRRSLHDPIEEVYRRLCLRLARRGMARDLHEGPRDYAARLAGIHPSIPPAKLQAIVRFIGAYEAARYGPGSISAGPARRQLIHQLKTLLADI